DIYTKNPIAAILAAGMMLYYSLEMPAASQAVMQAARELVPSTAGLSPEKTGDLVIERIRHSLA
ncbi:MAG: hypothetical protein ACERKO_05010, partial [Acetanaerobacterium sp.]